MPKVNKSIEMTDVKIDFLSVVNKAANGFKFLVKKSEDEPQKFTYGSQIMKMSDLSMFDIEESPDKHYVAGVVYEPFTADGHDNFMSTEEIQKAMDYFIENGVGSDINHDEVPVSDVKILKCILLDEDLKTTDMFGCEVTIKKGSWLAAAEVSGDTFEKIEKGELTGWSMGGHGKYILEDVDLSKVEKSAVESIISKIAKAFGFTLDGTPVESDTFMTKFKEDTIESSFWTAFYTLQDILHPFDSTSGWNQSIQEDEAIVEKALQDFSLVIKGIIQDNKKNKGSILKAMKVPEDTDIIQKAGKKISTANMNKIKSAHEALGELIKLEEQEDTEMTEDQIKKCIAESVKSAMEETKTVEKSEEPADTPATETADVQKMVDEAVKKALTDSGVITVESQEQKIAKMVEESIAKALGSIKKGSTQVSAETEVTNIQEAPVAKGYMRNFAQ